MGVDKTWGRPWPTLWPTLWPTVAQIYRKWSIVKSRFIKAMSTCPPMRVTNSIVYSTIKGVLEKLSWNVLFAFFYLQMLSYTLPFITCFVPVWIVEPQPRPQGLLLDDFQNGGSSGEDPGTQQKSRDRFVHGGWKFIQNGGQDKE